MRSSLARTCGARSGGGDVRRSSYRGLNFCINRIRRTWTRTRRTPPLHRDVPRSGLSFTGRDAHTCAGERAPGVGPASCRPRRRGRDAALLATGRTRGRAGARRGRPQGAARAYARGLYQALRERRGGEPAFLRGGLAARAAQRLRGRRAGPGLGARGAGRDGSPRARACQKRAWRAPARGARRPSRGPPRVGHRGAAPRLGLGPADERSLGRALARDPGSAPRTSRGGHCCWAAGRPRAALRGRNAPSSSIPCAPWCAGRWASSYYPARRFGEAVEGLRRSLLVAPTLVGPHERLFHA